MLTNENDIPTVLFYETFRKINNYLTFIVYNYLILMQLLVSSCIMVSLRWYFVDNF